MSEYEMASWLQAQSNLIGAITMNYFTIATAYLVAGYLAAHRLTLSMSIIVTALFIAASLYFVGLAVGATRNVASMAEEMYIFAQSGKGLGWHTAAALPPYAWEVVTVAQVAIMLGVFVGCILFFFQSRRRNLPAAS